MGQKVNPIGLRLGINRTWDSRWFGRKEYGKLLLDDLGLRKFLQKRLTQAGLSRVIIERAAKRTRITLHSARPGVVIGKKGVDIEKLRPIPQYAALAERFFPSGEAPPQDEADFFRRWTRIEAVLKARGVGLIGSSLDVEGEWAIEEIDASGGFAGAVAAAGTSLAVTIHDYGDNE